MRRSEDERKGGGQRSVAKEARRRGAVGRRAGERGRKRRSEAGRRGLLALPFLSSATFSPQKSGLGTRPRESAGAGGERNKEGSAAEVKEGRGPKGTGRPGEAQCKGRVEQWTPRRASQKSSRLELGRKRGPFRLLRSAAGKGGWRRRPVGRGREGAPASPRTYKTPEAPRGVEFPRPSLPPAGSRGVTDHSFIETTRREAKGEIRFPNGVAAVQLARFLERRSGGGLSRARRASSGAKRTTPRDPARSVTSPLTRRNSAQEFPCTLVIDQGTREY